MPLRLLRLALAGSAAFSFAHLTGLPRASAWTWAAIAIAGGVALDRLLATVKQLPEDDLRSLGKETVAELTWSEVYARLLEPLAFSAAEGLFPGGSSISKALRAVFWDAITIMGKAARGVAAIQHLRGRSLWRLVVAFLVGCFTGGLVLSLAIGWYQSRQRVHQFTIQGLQGLRVVLPVGAKAGETVFLRYLVTNRAQQPLLPQPEGRLEVVGTALAARPYQEGGSNYPEWRWDFRADAGTYNATLSFPGLIFSGASIQGVEVPPGSPLERTADLATPLVDGARLKLTILTFLGLTVGQQNFAMAIGGIVATVAAALEIISRARTRLHSGNSGEPAPPIR